jgi:general stress protein 26
MTEEFIYDFISKHMYAVLSTVTPNHFPESAVVGFAVTKDLKIIFDTVTTSRKYQNLLKNPAIAFGLVGTRKRQFNMKARRKSHRIRSLMNF